VKDWTLCSYNSIIRHLEEWLQSDVCEPGFKYKTIADVSVVLLNKELRKTVGRMTVKEEETVIVLIILWQYSMLSLC